MAKIDEEEAWIAEKQNLMAVTDVGNSMAAVQGLMKKHDAFDNDLRMHDGHVEDVCAEGQALVREGNHHADNIGDRLRALVDRMNDLKAKAAVRKQNLVDNSAYMQFMWKADVVESWIVDKEAYVRSDEFGRDLSSVQTLLTKQETFDIGLESFEAEGIANLTELKGQLSFRSSAQAEGIQRKFDEVIGRWQRLIADSNARKQRLLQVQDQFRKIEELYLTFAKKASAFNSWFENAEEDMTDPVRCNSVEEIRSLREAHSQFQVRTKSELNLAKVAEAGPKLLLRSNLSLSFSCPHRLPCHLLTQTSSPLLSWTSKSRASTLASTHTRGSLWRRWRTPGEICRKSSRRGTPSWPRRQRDRRRTTSCAKSSPDMQMPSTPGSLRRDLR